MLEILEKKPIWKRLEKHASQLWQLIFESRLYISKPSSLLLPRAHMLLRRPALGQERPFDRMNSLVGHLLNNLTSSMRFEGSLNLDLNEITMNLVPFPRMHFLLASMSPLYFGRDPRLVSRGRGL